MEDENEAFAAAGEEVPDDFWDAFDFDEGDVDFEDDDYSSDLDEGEEEEEELLDDEDHADYFKEAEGVKKPRLEEEQDDAASLSSLSNETDVDVSDEELPDVERTMAGIFPEPPWRKSAVRIRKILLSCLLPFLLILLLLYTIFKIVKLMFQIMYDAYIMARYVVFLAIRICLFPFFLVWKLTMPSFIQAFVWEKYDARIGQRLRKVLAFKRRVEAAIADIPNVLTACALAGFDTFIVPTYKYSKICCWRLVGTHFFHGVLQPVHNAKINSASQAKRRFSQGIENEKDTAASQSEMAAKRLKKAKIKARREKAKRMRSKRKMQQHQIALHLPADQKMMQLGLADVQIADEAGKVQLQEQVASQLKTRTMVIERRYALAVGFIWGCAGIVVLVLTLDGAKDEICEICSDMPELNMRMCRHGTGQDCAFAFHTTEVITSIGLMGVGLMLLIYAAFLYRPSGLADKIAAEEDKAAERLAQAKLSRLRRAEDAEMQVLNLIEEHLLFVTIPMKIKEIYYASPLASLQYSADRLGLSIMRRLLKIEHRQKLKQRGMWMQDAVVFVGYGWAMWAYKKMRRCWEYLKSKRRRTPFSQTRCGRVVSPLYRAVARIYLCRMFMYWTGLGSPKQKEDTDSGAVKIKVTSSNRAADSKGAITLEETIQKFGLYRDLAEEATKRDEVSSSKGGYDEACLEAGTDDIDEDVLEEEPIFEDLDRHMHPAHEDEEVQAATAEEYHIN